MNYLLIWGILAALIIVILLISMSKTFKAHQLNIILMDHYTAGNAAAVGTEIANLTTSDDSLIHVLHSTTQYVPAPTTTLPQNVLEIKIGAVGTVYIYLIIGARYKVVGNTAAATPNDVSTITLVDLVSSKMFKLLIPISSTTTPALLTQENSIIIPFPIAAIATTNVTAKLVLNKTVPVTGNTNVNFLFIGYK